MSDHHRILISDSDHVVVRGPFRYFNAWAKEENFYNFVKNASIAETSGTAMFRVVQKLKNVKRVLINWNRARPHISNRVEDARKEPD